MTESALTLEWYISEVRIRVKSMLLDEKFVGNIKFEFNIKNSDIVNMNVDKRESIRAS